MHKMLSVGVLAAALCAMSPLSASASFINYNSGDSAGAFVGNFNSGTFNDAYNFTVLTPSLVSVSLTATPFSSVTLTDFYLFENNPNNTTTQVTSSFATTDNSSSFSGSISPVDLDAGNYFISVKGSFSGSNIYTGTLHVSAVPLPGSVGLFGLSVMTLGAFGLSRRRKAGSKPVSISA